MITVDDGGGEGGKNCQNIDYVICERPLILVKYLFKDRVDVCSAMRYCAAPRIQ